MAAFIRFLAASATGSSPSTATAATTTTVRAIAKDRLSVILASQRGSALLEGVNMEQLQRDVLRVVQQHLDVAHNRPVHFSLNADGDVRLFEMSIELGQQEQQLDPRHPNATPKADNNNNNNPTSSS